MNALAQSLSVEPIEEDRGANLREELAKIEYPRSRKTWMAMPCRAG